MNAVIIHKSIAPTLSNYERQIVNARENVRVKEINAMDLKTKLSETISKAFFDCRYAVPQPMEFKIMVDGLYKDVSNCASTLTIEEINICFRNGCGKVYGEFTGLSNATFRNWLHKFIASPERQSAIKKQQEFLTPPPKILTEKEKDELLNKGVLALFEDFKKKGSVLDIGGISYDYLDKIGLLRLSKARKLEIKSEAQSKLEIEAERKKQSAKGFVDLRDAIKQLDAIKDGSSDKIKFECKRIALNNYFKELVENGFDLKDLMI